MKRCVAHKVTLKLHAMGYDTNGGGPVENSSWLSSAEKMLHEHAHAVTLGKGVKPGDIDDVIREMTKKAADWNELRTLAVERLVLNALDLHVSTKRLAEYASLGMQTPPYHGVNGPKNVVRDMNRLMSCKSIQKLAEQVVEELT